jgi:hypothetical protein
LNVSKPLQIAAKMNLGPPTKHPRDPQMTQSGSKMDQDDLLGASWGPLGDSGSLMGPLGSLLGPLRISWEPDGGLLGVSGGPLGASWGSLGGPLGSYGALRGPLGTSGGSQCTIYKGIGAIPLVNRVYKGIHAIPHVKMTHAPACQICPLLSLPSANLPSHSPLTLE